MLKGRLKKLLSPRRKILYKVLDAERIDNQIELTNIEKYVNGDLVGLLNQSNYMNDARLESNTKNTTLYLSMEYLSKDKLTEVLGNEQF